MIFDKQDGKSTKIPTGLAVLPSSPIDKTPLDLPDDFPVRLRKAIMEAESTFKSGHFSSALMNGGRALEGLFKTFSNNNDATLAKLIDEVCGSETATLPLRSLAHAIREGRNAGAHFDESIEPDAESAALMIELLHYIIGYFVILPKKISKLEKKVKRT
ncbi:DUF4145 domain-containing protein [Dinoroseobacter sp. S124A]|uniref:DUF4145 domain-containing protein n=1 Tax=Dinoroseobacter sp. S124A TaxID=3415128 RepID=UPI003C7C1E83